MQSYHILCLPFIHLEPYSINSTSTSTYASPVIISNGYVNVFTPNPRIVSKQPFLQLHLNPLHL
jgi:hypothetical protein